MRAEYLHHEDAHLALHLADLFQDRQQTHACTVLCCSVLLAHVCFHPRSLDDVDFTTSKLNESVVQRQCNTLSRCVSSTSCRCFAQPPHGTPRERNWCFRNCSQNSATTLQQILLVAQLNVSYLGMQLLAAVGVALIGVAQTLGPAYAWTLPAIEYHRTLLSPLARLESASSIGLKGFSRRSLLPAVLGLRGSGIIIPADGDDLSKELKRIQLASSETDPTLASPWRSDELHRFTRVGCTYVATSVDTSPLCADLTNSTRFCNREWELPLHGERVMFTTPRQYAGPRRSDSIRVEWRMSTDTRLHQASWHQYSWKQVRSLYGFRQYVMYRCSRLERCRHHWMWHCW